MMTAVIDRTPPTQTPMRTRITIQEVHALREEYRAAIAAHRQEHA